MFTSISSFFIQSEEGSGRLRRKVRWHPSPDPQHYKGPSVSDPQPVFRTRSRYSALDPETNLHVYCGSSFARRI
jgi:hypothetical protein